MMKNAKELVATIVENDIAEISRAKGSISDEEKIKIQLSACEILAQGSVEQRNWEMNAVRKKISCLGRLFSWFLKQRGLSYKEIEEKYKKEFVGDDQGIYWEIISSAARTNPDLFNKFIGKFNPSKL
jgi:hypothetical protein